MRKEQELANWLLSESSEVVDYKEIEKVEIKTLKKAIAIVKKAIKTGEATDFASVVEFLAKVLEGEKKGEAFGDEHLEIESLKAAIKLVKELEKKFDAEKAKEVLSLIDTTIAKEKEEIEEGKEVKDKKPEEKVNRSSATRAVWPAGTCARRVR